MPRRLMTKRTVLLVAGAALIFFGLASRRAVAPLPADLPVHIKLARKNTYLDRNGIRLNVTYDNRWNTHDYLKLHEIPEFLQRAFIVSEDRRFYRHRGVDWLARLSGMRQNLLAFEVQRGASTITEQVVRMIHPRPRTFWSRWIEGLEARELEGRHDKVEIFEFYLNQVPYLARRRGVAQAADYYFDRDLTTLNEKEQLALAVLVRAPKWLDPGRKSSRLESAIANLAGRLELGEAITKKFLAQELALHGSTLEHDLSHFIAYADSRLDQNPLDGGSIHTTIDLELQVKAQKILDNRLERLAKLKVMNGAMLVVDHDTNEIIAWVVGNAGREGKEFNRINAVRTPRQPGSTLKPFLYAKALQKGWTAATMIDDAPLEEGVGPGLHAYDNYSRGYYGLVSVRAALGNSLNIPAVKAIQFVGPGDFLNFLHELGIESLSGHPNVYGDGLALGNGELTLLELVQAYTVLARMGDFKPLTFIAGEHPRSGGYRVLSEDIASLIADILSDPAARELEFGWDSILNFPRQTAVKTGTSSDYRDAWAVGVNDRYTVGVWLGNLDYTSMDRVTGSLGPSLVLRSLFSELDRNREVRPLYLSENLVSRQVCSATGLAANGDCETRDEWFLPGTYPALARVGAPAETIRLRKPSKNLMLAMDPRIPDQAEYFEFALNETGTVKKVEWYINDLLVGVTDRPTFNWKVSRGKFSTRAVVTLKDAARPVTTEAVGYQVN